MNPVLQFILFFFPPALWLGGLLGLLLPRRLARAALNRYGLTVGRAVGLGVIVFIWLLAVLWMFSPAYLSGEFTFFYLLIGGAVAVVQILIFSILHSDDRRKFAATANTGQGEAV